MACIVTSAGGVGAGMGAIRHAIRVSVGIKVRAPAWHACHVTVRVRRSLNVFLSVMVRDAAQQPWHACGVTVDRIMHCHCILQG